MLVVTRTIPMVALAGFLAWWGTAKAGDFTDKGKVPHFKMPGKSHVGNLPELTAEQRELANELRHDVTSLAETIGERNVRNYRGLAQAARFVEGSLRAAGFTVERQTYQVRGRECSNLIAELRGSDLAEQILVIGGHYDSAQGSPGANDNATGAAATLALARRFADSRPRRTMRFVLFTNEEPPWFQSEAMGSLVYALRCQERKENVVAMFSLETMGYFSDTKGSQKYPAFFSLYYPSVGNFIGFVGNVESGPLVSWTTKSFRGHAQFPSEGAAVPGRLTGVGWSDHWSFWQAGYRALMVTDTAPFRYPHYHSPEDTPDKVDFDKMARVVSGLEKVFSELANPKEEPAKKRKAIFKFKQLKAP